MSASLLLQVHEDYDCMLNQTNIGHNNNKFYVIQVLTSGTKHYCWTRWGRVVSCCIVVLKGYFKLSTVYELAADPDRGTQNQVVNLLVGEVHSFGLLG